MYGALAVLVSVFLLALFFICGVLAKKLCCAVTHTDFESDKAPFLLPVLGAALLICITQTLNILMPVRTAAFILLPLLIFFIYVCRKELSSSIKAVIRQKGSLFLVFVTCVLVLIPCIRYNEIISLYYYSNNDIIYYLADIEWFRDNAFFDTKEFSATQPFYGLVQYMTTTTRVGMDMLGALIISWLPLEPHQVYLIMCAVFSALCVCAVTHFLQDVLKTSEKSMLLLSLFLGSGIAIIELTKQQYAPQILGVAFFITFVTLTNKVFFSEEKNAADPVFLGIAVSAVISVYAEYATYVVIVFAMAYFIAVIAKRNKASFLGHTFTAVITVLVAILANIPGFIIALRFNLNVILASLSNLDNINPVGFMQADLPTVIKYLTNLQLVGDGQMFKLFGLTLPLIVSKLLAIVLIAALIALVAFVIIGAIRRHGAKELHLALCLVFFTVYWAFFRKTEYAYGEYKHIHLVLWVTFAILAYFADIGANALLSKDFAPKTDTAVKAVNTSTKVGVAVLCSVMLFISAQNAYMFSSISRSEYRFDGNMDELRDAVVANVPNDECIGILGDAFFENHALVYSVRNTGHSLSLLSSSYYTFFVPTHPEFPKYTAFSVFKGRYGDILDLEDHTVLWKNERYCLAVNNTDVGIFMRSGFSAVNYTDPEYLYRTVGADSTVEVGNTGETEHIVTVNFNTKSYDGTARRFNVYNGETLIGNGVSDTEITTAEFSVPANSSVTLRIEVTNPSGQYDLNIYSLDTNIIS